MRGKQHLTKSWQYGRVYEKGSTWVSRLVVMKAAPNSLTFSRYGILASKKVGGAVIRNRVKRLLREIMRVAPIKSGWDVVFIARPAAASTDFASIGKAVSALLSQAQLLKGENERVCLEVN